MFNPNLEVGQTIRNSDIVSIFKCGNMGGMRRSKATNTLVIITDYTKGLYHDKWIGGVLHYTGMGKHGDQDVNWAQNATLSASDTNGVSVHLFEVMDAWEYIYCGRVVLAGQPYTDIQPDEDGCQRTVWIFPVRPVPENNVKKPEMFVFRDMEDYRAHGRDADAAYQKLQSQNKAANKSTAKPASPAAPIHTDKPEPKACVPPDVLGKKIKHRLYGVGTITDISGDIISVSFSAVGAKKLSYETCIKNKLIEFL